MPESPEAPEIALCKKGDEEGFRRLFEAYRGYVYSLCFSVSFDREEALDICQEVFLAVFRGMKSVRSGAPLKPWLRRVAVNVCLNYIASSRSGARNHPVDMNDLGILAGDDPVGEVEGEEARWEIRRALGSLQPDQRLAVVLFHQEELSYEEIAAATGWPLGTVKTNLFRGRKEMGKHLRSYFGGGTG